VGYLVVLERSDAITWLSLRNAPEVHIVAVDQLNTYDVLNADDVVFTQGAYDAFVGGVSAAPAKAETKTEPAAAKAEKAEPKTEARPRSPRSPTSRPTTSPTLRPCRRAPRPR
jgi:large subunit ribosomal protein L4